MLNRDNSIFVIIDIQEKLVPAMYDGESIIENNVKLINGMHLFNVPIVITEQYPRGLGKTVQPIIEALGDLYNPIEKMTFSCMGEKNFIELMETFGKRNVIISGMESHVCVLQTVLQLKEAGYNPIVIEDCICSRKDNDHYIAIERMVKEGITLSTLESILFQICGTSLDENFKALSKLVK